MLLVGTGHIMELPPRSVVEACKEYKIGLHIESTPQAIQTYGVLLEDRRNFAALLIPSSTKFLGEHDVIKLQKRTMITRQNMIQRGEID